MSRFGENLRKIRNERGMSQDEMATLLGTSKQVISRYENGQRNPKVSVAQDYADRLGVSIGFLTGDTTGEEEIEELKSSVTEAQRKLREIAEGLPTAKHSKGWKMLSRGFTRMESEREEDYNRILSMLGAAYPEFFYEGDDDDDPRP